MNSVSAVTASVVLSVIASSLQAQETIEPVVVTATRTELRDTDAPYASEVHTREAIEQSGAINLYDYLDKHSSLTVMPSYGNPFSQLLDMRGYGIGSGHQNIVVTVDGRRLNNIDLAPQLLSALPLAAIERIEIIKGSGSVINGDGATAGSINIITREVAGASLAMAAGSHGIASSSASAGFSTDYASLSVLADNYRQDGFRAADPEGNRDEADSNTTRALLRLYPTDTTELRLGKELAWINTTYGDYLTKSQFDADPAQYGANGWATTYTAQKYHTDTSSLGLTTDINPQFKLVLDHSQEDKTSQYVGYDPYRYDYRNSDIALHYHSGPWQVIAGWQLFDGARKASDNTTGKENTSAYLQGHLQHGQTLWSAGARSERVRYTYNPLSGTSLQADHDLSAYDFGLNHRLSDQLSLFASYNYAYQAPDIDRFFTTDWFAFPPQASFNAFIEPARVRTLNAGINHNTANNKLKLTAFHASLENEIYYYSTGPWTGFNTNIDTSHKYGIELQETHLFNERLSASLLYSYTRAIIDEESEAGGAYDGQDLPGVSPHTASIGLSYATGPQSMLTLSHTYRSEAYAANDFANDFTQKQAAYHSTGLGYSYRLKPVELFMQVDNLFSHANGLWIEDDVIYPVNFERSWRVGLKAQL